jgi:hypothetical protein
MPVTSPAEGGAIMTVAEAREGLQELMARYNEYQKKWIALYGTTYGFDQWFTQQVLQVRVS